MPLQAFAAHSSRITKKPNKKLSLLKRNSSPSCFLYADLPRRRPAVAPKAKAYENDKKDDEFFGDRLEDTGLVEALATDLTLRDVAQAIQYARAQMFSSVPEAGGMNSLRIAEVLNFRKKLSPLVSVAHVQALLNSPTTTERDIAELVRGGAVRRIVIPGRGNVGEVLVLVKDFISMIRNTNSLSESAKEEFIKVLQENPAAMTIPQSKIRPEVLKEVMHFGFLTCTTAIWSTTDAYARPGEGSKGTMASIESVSKAASGSIAAVGGIDALTATHGNKSSAQSSFAPSHYTIAIPSTGPYLKLLTSARQHLLFLLNKCKYKEAPVNLLRDRWDGGIIGDDISMAKRNRNEFAGVLPGKTRKWKSYFGLRFEWVLAECVGAGLLEVFETGCVGWGIRMV